MEACRGAHFLAAHFGLHYGQAPASTSRQDTFEQTNSLTTEIFLASRERTIHLQRSDHGPNY